MAYDALANAEKNSQGVYRLVQLKHTRVTFAQEAEFANFRRFPKAAVQPKDSECRVSA